MCSMMDSQAQCGTSYDTTLMIDNITTLELEGSNILDNELCNYEIEIGSDVNFFDIKIDNADNLSMFMIEIKSDGTFKNFNYIGADSTETYFTEAGSKYRLIAWPDSYDVIGEFSAQIKGRQTYDTSSEDSTILEKVPTFVTLIVAYFVIPWVIMFSIMFLLF